MPSFLSHLLLAGLASISLSIAVPLDTFAPKTNNAGVRTPFGVQQGIRLANGVERYQARYGTADEVRWGTSSLPRPVAIFDGRSLPPSCPQVPSFVAGSSTSEDCLRMVIYTPSTTRKLPVMVWVHGGSFVAGSASAPGLDASVFAQQNSIVVVVVQYRLGVLGFLPPAESGASNNLGLSDVVLALQYIQKAISSYGGDPAQVTVAGQSSGGHMIRALLASPPAQPHFRAAILQSDPMTYGMARPSDTALLAGAFYSSLPSSNLTTLRAMPITDIISAQSEFLSYAPALSPSIPLASPLRPTSSDAALLPLDFAQALATSKLPAGALSKPLLFTTTKDEFAQSIGALNPEPIDENTFFGELGLFVPDQDEAEALLARYPLGTGSDAGRETLTTIGTLKTWTCAVRHIAELWASKNGKVFVAEFESGIPYLDNQQNPFCSGRVCHEDDIFATFGTGPSFGVQSPVLSDEVMSRWQSFVGIARSGTTARRASYPAWMDFKGESTVNPIGGTSKVARTCPAGFFGHSPVLFHWQQYS